MRRAERLFRLVNELRSRPIARASDLATACDVSLSTIYRDIAHLQGSGLPIEGEAGVGYLLRPGFEMPNVAFTHDQVDALAIGLAFVERTGDPALATAAREARAMIQAGMPSPEQRRLADAPYFSLHAKAAERSFVADLRDAIRQRRVAGIDYRSADGTPTARRVRPLVIWDLPDGWMMSGWCELRDGFRTFRLDRISELRLTQDRFADDPDRGLAAFLSQDVCDT